MSMMNGFLGRSAKRQAQEAPRADSQPEHQEAYVDQAAGEVADVARTLLECSSTDSPETIWDTAIDSIGETMVAARERYGLPQAYETAILEKAKERLRSETISH